MESLFISLGLPQDLAVFITAVILVTILITFLAIFAGFMTWIERRLAARFQFRCGPNRVGPQGLLQWLADAVKLIVKEEITIYAIATIPKSSGNNNLARINFTIKSIA